jgi:exopolysaccharide production protein ExoY
MQNGMYVMSFVGQILPKSNALALRDNGRPLGGPIKRAVDIILALAAIVMLIPLFAGCALAVFVTSPGPILFRHRRLGYGGRQFSCLKFRTMEVDADRRLQEYLASDPDARREWNTTHKLRNDPRVTIFGQLMRRSSLDELPQLFNILKGDMSMVGPRPIVEAEVEKYQEHFGLYAAGRPGLTGLWQIKGRNSTTYAERVAYDVEYRRNWSLVRDVKIIFATVAHVFHGRGAY